MFALAVGRVAVPHRRRCPAAGGPVIANVDPDPPGLRAPASRIEHRDRRVVTVHLRRLKHVAAECFDQRSHQRRAAGHPLGQQRPIQFDAGAAEDRLLPVQGAVVGVLGNDHLRQQRRGRQTAFDRPRRRRQLHDLCAVTTRQLRPDVAQDTEVARHIVQLLGDVLAECAHRAAAVRTGTARRCMHDDLARQVCRQFAALAGAGLAVRLTRRRGRFLRFLSRDEAWRVGLGRWLDAGRCGGRLALDALEQQLQL